MNQRTLEDRVEILERKVEGLETLPARVAAVELQISQFRDEVRVEFAGVRREMREGHEQLRTEMHRLNEERKTHMLVLHEEVISRFALLTDGTTGKKSRPGTRRGSARRPPKGHPASEPEA